MPVFWGEAGPAGRSGAGREGGPGMRPLGVEPSPHSPVPARL